MNRYVIYSTIKLTAQLIIEKFILNFSMSMGTQLYCLPTLFPIKKGETLIGRDNLFTD